MSTFNADTLNHPVDGGEIPGSGGSGPTNYSMGVSAPPSGGFVQFFNPTIIFSLGCVNNGPGGLSSTGQGQIFPTGRS
jgi:hypothetical protein